MGVFIKMNNDDGMLLSLTVLRLFDYIESVNNKGFAKIRIDKETHEAMAKLISDKLKVSYNKVYLYIQQYGIMSIGDDWYNQISIKHVSSKKVLDGIIVAKAACKSALTIQEKCNESIR
jgi:hypothetical protein